MIDLIAAAGIGGIIGFGTCAFLTMGKVADADQSADILERVEGNLLAQIKSKQQWITRAYNAENAHDRCADALETARNRIEYALEQETPGSNATVKRIARILRGEQG